MADSTMLPLSLSGSQCVQSMLSTKNHPRYHIRMIAIGSVAIGIFFNILSIAICKDHILQGLAFLPLCTLRKLLVLEPIAWID